MASIRDMMSEFKVSSKNPVSFEKISHVRAINCCASAKIAVKLNDPRQFPISHFAQGHGWMFYETKVGFRPPYPAVLKIPGIRDRGYVYIDDVRSRFKHCSW